MTPSIGERLHELRNEWRIAIRRHPYAIGSVTATFALVVVLVLGGGLWFLFSLQRGLPDEEAVRRIGEMDQATSVYDANDKLVFTLYKEQRIEVPFAEVSPHLIRAIIAIEDQRFYEHHGADGPRILSAALANIRRWRVAQGGSTITQQLARQSFLRPEKTLRRKLQELILAARIERLYSKSQILELYLNKVYFGDGLYGAEAASRGYFGKHASELTLPEAALLAGLVKSPSSYAPTVNLSRATSRRNQVLQAMLDKRDIDRVTWEAAKAAPVELHDNLRADEPHGKYFKEQVRRELVDRFGWQRVYQGGLRVYSTIDMPMQIAAEAVVDESLKALDARRLAVTARRGSRKALPESAAGVEAVPLQAALEAMDPHTGHVRAMVGGRDFDGSHFNRAVQARRQPGSAFKPFVYAAALESGYTPATVIEHLDDPVATLQGDWTPEDEHSSGESMTLRTGLRTSSNRAAVRLLQDVGIPRTVQYIRRMGIGEVPSVPSLALGSGEVTLQSLTAAYAAFANDGLVPHPILIRRVEDQDGEVLYAAQEWSTPAISNTTAFLMATMMADVIDAGTAAGVRRFGFTLPAAGKTGTTNDFNDAWFIGFTPRLVTGVWVGFDRPNTILPRGFAATIAVPVWSKFMKIATRNDKPEWFQPPLSVITATICRLSGNLASDDCEAAGSAYTEYFPRGTEPVWSCDMHSIPATCDTVASGMFRNEEIPLPPRIEETGVAQTPTAVGSSGWQKPAPSRGDTAMPAPAALGSAGQIELPPAPSSEPAKKRPWWKFGIGQDRLDPEADSEPIDERIEETPENKR